MHGNNLIECGGVDSAPVLLFASATSNSFRQGSNAGRALKQRLQKEQGTHDERINVGCGLKPHGILQLKRGGGTGRLGAAWLCVKKA